MKESCLLITDKNGEEEFNAFQTLSPKDFKKWQKDKLKQWMKDSPH